MENGEVKLDDNLLGFATFNQGVVMFNFGNALVRKDFRDCQNVRLISGGSRCFKKFVGKGMLTAIVQGEKDDSSLEVASPTSKLILRVLRELSVNHHKGILVIVEGDSSNMLNFGLAVERAVNDDLSVMILGVSEDASNKDFAKAHKKGLSGIVLVQKIAGGMAENGSSLNEIHDFCSKVVENMSSSAALIPEKTEESECLVCNRCKLHESELEHAQSKKSKLSLLNKIKSKENNQIVNYKEIFKKLFTDIQNEDKLNFDQKTNSNLVIILINNQNGLASTQEYILVKEIVSYLQELGIFVVRLYIGNFLRLNTNLDISFTVLKLFESDVLKYLDASCDAPGWKAVKQDLPYLTTENSIISGCLRRKCRLSPPTKGPKLKDKPTNVLQVSLQFACDAVISCSKMLNKIDAEKGDGDTGTRLRNVAEVLHKRIKDKKLVLNCPFTLFLSLSKILESTVGGTQGCIYSILFEAAANKFGQYGEDVDVTPQMWLEALENGCDSVEKFGNVDLGDQTMYDSLRMCATTVRDRLTQNPENYLTAFEAGVFEAEKAAQNTRKEGCKYPDPGAHAVGIWMRAVFEGVKLKCGE